jgi:hypothetical protein
MRRASVLIVFVVAACLAAGSGLAAAQGAAAGQEKQAAAAGDPITGDWSGTVESPQGTIGFTLTLKLENGKVTGEIASDQGGTSLAGTWTEGKLSANFDYNGTPVAMTGSFKDDVFGGEMNMGGGQMVMSWTAKKKAAAK